MAEEVHESEIIFQENSNYEEGNCNFSLNPRESRNKKKKRKKQKTNDFTTSSPVNIPVSMHRNSWLQLVDADLDGDDGEIVPPHVIIGRRVGRRVMAYSVCTGIGRTLKGRDLREVRNSILRMTGFLET